MPSTVPSRQPGQGAAPQSRAVPPTDHIRGTEQSRQPVGSLAPKGNRGKLELGSVPSFSFVALRLEYSEYVVPPGLGGPGGQRPAVLLRRTLFQRDKPSGTGRKSSRLPEGIRDQWNTGVLCCHLLMYSPMCLELCCVYYGCTKTKVQDKKTQE